MLKALEFVDGDPALDPITGLGDHALGDNATERGACQPARTGGFRVVAGRAESLGVAQLGSPTDVHGNEWSAWKRLKSNGVRQC